MKSCLIVFCSFYVCCVFQLLFAQKEVSVVPLEKMEFRASVSTEGEVQAKRRFSLVSKVEGEVVQVFPERFFRKGDILLKIYNPSYELARKKAIVEYEEAKNALKLMEIKEKAFSRTYKILKEKYVLVEEECKRNEKLREAGSLSADEYARSKEKLYQARLELEETNLEKELFPILLSKNQILLELRKMEIDKTELLLRATRIEAPFDGFILERKVMRDEFVRPGDELLELVDIQEFEIVFSLGNEEVENLVEDQKKSALRNVPMEVKLIWEDNEYQGRCEYLFHKVDEKTKGALFQVSIQEPFKLEPPLALGALCQIEILGRRLDNVFLVPLEALKKVLGDNEDLLYVVFQDKLFLERVEIMKRIKEGMLVRSPNLKEGSLVVVSSIGRVFSGMPVKVKR